jgi:hypothetical protein
MAMITRAVATANRFDIGGALNRCRAGPDQPLRSRHTPDGAPKIYKPLGPRSRGISDPETEIFREEHSDDFFWIFPKYGPLFSWQIKYSF